MSDFELDDLIDVMQEVIEARERAILLPKTP
jgi:hypothetical protein